MVKKYLPRTIEPEIKRASRQFPVLVLTGPRQTGKSTLFRKLFPKHRYVTLDDPFELRILKKDPALFFENNPGDLILDEIQHAAKILPYIKILVDRDRSKNGRILLTGSQIFSLMQGVTESLAGRAAMFELLGFSWDELKPKDTSAGACFQRIWTGFYPEPAVHGVSSRNFYPSYLKTYLERDIRQIRSVHDLSLFQDFLELLAARAASLLNLHEIAKECGISHSTARSWLSLLESTRIVYLLRPYHRNISKRVIKSPKIYFTDTGLLAALLKYPDARVLQSGPMAGAFFENMVVTDLLKTKFNINSLAELYFFRDSNGNEADILIHKGDTTILLEVKATKTITASHERSLDLARKNFRDSKAYFVSLVGQPADLARNTRAISWREASHVLW